MSNAISAGPSAQLKDDSPASAQLDTVRKNEEFSWHLTSVFDGKFFSEAWLDTLNLQFGVEK